MELSFETIGTPGDTPLVILHGLFGAGRNWRSFANRLAPAGYLVYLVDQRNHGNSPWHDSMDYKAMAEDLADFMEAHGLAEAHLLGHSMGGKTVMRLILQEPQLCLKPIILDIAPVPYVSRFDALVEAMLALPLEQCSSRGDADRFLEHNVSNRELRQFLLQNLRAADEGYQWNINLEAIRDALEDIHDFPEPLQGVHFPRPVLFLHGMDSDYILPEHREEILSLFPRAEIRGVPDAGHWLHSEQPGETASMILGFLATRDAQEYAPEATTEAHV